MTNEEFQRAKEAGLAQRVLRENAAASFIHNWFKDDPLFKQAAEHPLQSDEVACEANHKHQKNVLGYKECCDCGLPLRR